MRIVFFSRFARRKCARQPRTFFFFLKVTITVTPSKLVCRSASKNRSSHSLSLYRKSAMVRFSVPLSCDDWWTFRATSWIARAAVHTPSYVYPWNREYSSPRLMSYSWWYSLDVCGQINGIKRCDFFFFIIITGPARTNVYCEHTADDNVGFIDKRGEISRPATRTLLGNVASVRTPPADNRPKLTFETSNVSFYNHFDIKLSVARDLVRLEFLYPYGVHER